MLLDYIFEQLSFGSLKERVILIKLFKNEKLMMEIVKALSVESIIVYKDIKQYKEPYTLVNKSRRRRKQQF